ncbi:MAG: peroxidase family protein [Pseudonocardiaceae bacterium]
MTERGHGRASRLPLEGVDTDAVDAILDSGGEGAAGARFALTNTFTGPNRFGRMFPRARRFRPASENLVALAEGMVQERLTVLTPDTDDIKQVPAGFTYLGQFVDHDITRDPTVGFPPVGDPENLESLRTPRLELDSVYGMGPVDQPELYDPAFPATEARMRIGWTTDDGDATIPKVLPNDLPRATDGSRQALVGDDRNDENLVLAQLHLAFLKLHNKVIAGVITPPGGETAFDAARRQVRWHYQWIVLHDFLPRIVDPVVLDDIRANGRKFYDFSGPPFDGTPYMPVEFSVAAYRMGHSMIRDLYNYNRRFSSDEGAFKTPATLRILFIFTGAGGFGGEPTLPSNWVIDWRRWFEVDDPGLLNHARKIDTKLAHGLTELPDLAPGEQQSVFASLTVRNLLRGRLIGLPSGQELARLMSVPVLTPAELTRGESKVVARLGFDQETPLWFYLLKEAEVRAGGLHLGAMGSRLVGEVFLGMLEGDQESFLSVDPTWTPTLPAAQPGSFTMADLLRFVDDLNPIGPTNP